MCGIAGAVGVFDPNLVDRMLAAIAHRGPDGVGSYRADRVQVGACRLAIVDPSAPPQPIWDERHHVCVVFNGEIYNHMQLRAELQRHGHRFTTRTDTETLVHLYEDLGAGMFERLRGMFALAVVDGDRVVLGRDRLGIKPLYVARAGAHGVLFGSEIKALLQCSALRPGVDEQTLADMAVLGHEVGTATLLTGIETVPPGHYQWIAAGGPSVAVRFIPQVSLPTDPIPDREGNSGSRARSPGVGIREVARASADERSLDAAAREVHDALAEAIESQLRADVPVAMTLSGGVDSSLAALIALRVGARLDTYTVADSPTHPDLMLASRLAAEWGLPHHEVVPTWDTYLQGIGRAVSVEERPLSLATVPFVLLCERISQDFSVCLHGEGADEVFAGYREHEDKAYRLDVFARRLQRVRRAGLRPSDSVLELVETILRTPEGSAYTQVMRRHGLGDQLERQHLGPVDRASMAAGLEIRVPYLADRVVDTGLALPPGLVVEPGLRIRKYVLRRLLAQLGGPEVFDVTHRLKIGVPSAASNLAARAEAIVERQWRFRGVEGGGEYDELFETAWERLAFRWWMDAFVTRPQGGGQVDVAGWLGGDRSEGAAT